MKKLSKTQLHQLDQALRRNRLQQALHAELIDHLALDIEYLMAGGESYEVALQRVLQEASPQALDHLKQTYQQVLHLVPLPALLNRLAPRRYAKRRSRPGQYQQWQQASILAFVTLIICLMWVCQVFAVPLQAFGTVWLVGLASVFGAISARWLFRRRPRRVRPHWA
ncbi:hypothetical protein [Spirosoma fluminis]